MDGHPDYSRLQSQLGAARDSSELPRAYAMLRTAIPFGGFSYSSRGRKGARQCLDDQRPTAALPRMFHSKRRLEGTHPSDIMDRRGTHSHGRHIPVGCGLCHIGTVSLDNRRTSPITSHHAQFHDRHLASILRLDATQRHGACTPSGQSFSPASMHAASFRL